MLDVVGKDCFEVMAAEESIRSRDSRRMVPMTRSQMALVLGARTGVVMTLVDSAAKTASNEAVNLVSRSRIKNLTVRAWLANSMEWLRACWVTQLVTGLHVMPAIRTRRVSCGMNTRT
jgi:hypothetical protein